MPGNKMTLGSGKTGTFSGILIFVNYAILLLLYVLLLMLFGELRKEDVSLVQKIFKRGH